MYHSRNTVKTYYLHKNLTPIQSKPVQNLTISGLKDVYTS